MAPTKAMVKRDLLKITKLLTPSKLFIDSSEEADLEILESMRQDLISLADQLKSLTSDILDITCDDDNQDKSDFEKYESEASTLFTQVRDLINKSAKEIERRKTSSPEPSLSPSSQSSSVAALPQIKLPQIELPTFNGSHGQFTDFHNTFQSLVHENSSLTAVQKLHYLRSCLKGQAAEVISAISISEDNYKVAWDLLVQQYQNRRRIVETHLNAVFSIPGLPKFDNGKALSHLYNEVQKNLKALAALDLDPSSGCGDIILIHVVKQKLNNHLLKEWELTIHHLQDELPTLAQFLEFLLKHSRVQEAMQFTSENRPGQTVSGSSGRSNLQGPNKDVLGFRVNVRAPRYVMLGDTAKLMCDYNVAYKDLYKVVWYQNSRKIYQYVKGRTPPQTSYVKNLKIDLNKSDSINLVLRNANFDMSGLYSCEVTTESPIYSKPSDDILLTVMESQKEDPQITFRKPIYSVGDQLEVNCTSGMATPTPDVTWLINGKQVQNGLVKSYQQKPSSVTVQLSFQLTDEHLDEINLTCMSTIPGFLGHGASHKEYADHRTQSVTVQVKAPTPVNKSGAGRTASLACSVLVMFCVILQISSA